MSTLNSPFGRGDVKVLKEESLHSGFLKLKRLHLQHRLFEGGWSETFQRELMLRDEAVGVLLFDPASEELVLVRQFRVGMIEEQQSPWLLELVAGMVGKGEKLADVAVREAEEEANLAPNALIRICDYYNSPGSTNERITLFLGRVDAKTAGGVYGLENENEDIEVVKLSLESVLKALEEGQINNAMTLIALQWLQLNKAKLTSLWRPLSPA